MTLICFKLGKEERKIGHDRIALEFGLGYRRPTGVFGMLRIGVVSRVLYHAMFTRV
jgi:hypothetical protein